MEPDIKKLLEKNIELSRDNNRILRKIHSNLRWGRFFRLLYWVIIIGSMLGLYYFLQPFIDSTVDTYKGFLGGIEKVQDTVNTIPDAFLKNR